MDALSILIINDTTQILWTMYEARLIIPRSELFSYKK